MELIIQRILFTEDSFFYQIYIENIHFLQTLNNCMEIVILYGCRQIKKKGAHVYEG